MVGRSDHVTFLSLIKLCCALTDTNQLLAVRDYLTPKMRTQLEMTNGCDNTVYYRNIKLIICTSRGTSDSHRMSYRYFYFNPFD